ncbi:tryptophan synthase subunit alpha [Halobaculum rubrum]|uniref:tryptophan synthase subunit alpha n=1 Tax=Halobaculum rubrum TaxID=2872158 RepID=UPI001CA3980E|nr:tryptophan synthase subunit alpha [Halobaculum rubrum]QZY00039.1 tryptophan synthase subunit alpha [Halobaculum rubrum]
MSDDGASDRVAAAFADGPAFVPYLAVGDPDYESSLAYVEALAEGGADVIELGLPFSEPIAEGPTIQNAVVRALESGMTPTRFFEFVEEVDVDVPLVCMTYYNLIYQYGESEARSVSDASSAERSSANSRAAKPRDDGEERPASKGPRPFVEKAASVGISGFVVPDLPAEEAGPLREACDEFGLHLISIVAPTTDEERLDQLVEVSSGYLYVQARLGVTGASSSVSDRTGESLARLSDVDLPKAVGFGISSGEQAATIVEAGADGIIVGSALVDIVAEGHERDEPTEETAARLETKARELKQGAVDGYGRRTPAPEGTSD